MQNTLTEEAQTSSVCKVCSDPRIFFGNPKTSNFPNVLVFLASARPHIKSKKEKDGLYHIDVLLSGHQHSTVLRL